MEALEDQTARHIMLLVVVGVPVQSHGLLSSQDQQRRITAVQEGTRGPF